MLERTDKYWQEFTARRIDFNKILPASLPQRDKLIRTIDEVAVLIKAQQSSEGAVLAGYPYPLGYVRDQYGVSRGLLALGLDQGGQINSQFLLGHLEKIRVYTQCTGNRC